MLVLVLGTNPLLNRLILKGIFISKDTCYKDFNLDMSFQLSQCGPKVKNQK